jgi:hypothetical protein
VFCRVEIINYIARTLGCLIQIDYNNSTDRDAISILPVVDHSGLMPPEILVTFW